MEKYPVVIPDLGDAEARVEVIELLMAVGDRVDEGDILMVLESDKASLELPAPASGTVSAVKVAVGDELGSGALVAELQGEGNAAGKQTVESAPAAVPESRAQPVAAQPAGDGVPDTAAEAVPQAKPAVPESQPAATVAEQPAADVQTKISVAIPDLGDAEARIEVIELLMAVGDRVDEGDILMVLESDKASLELPAPASGTVSAVKVAVGDELGSGTQVAELLQGEGSPDGQQTVEPAPVAATKSKAQIETEQLSVKGTSATAAVSAPVSSHPSPATFAKAGKAVYAGPAVRKLAREFHIDLQQVKGSGLNGRIVKQDLQDFVKERISGGKVAPSPIPEIPEVDHSRFGPVRSDKMSRLERAVANNMKRSWLNIPHVTQFEELDIEKLEVLRGSLKQRAAEKGVKISPLPLLIKACAVALGRHPRLGASLHGDGKTIIYKDYIHIGIAVDVPGGLMVPVIRDVDSKDIWTLASEVTALAQAARDRKLSPADMQGGCFTVSSLGSIGGTGFTPIINAPELAILGVSRMQIKPVYIDGQFQPHKMLPVALSYDHRGINGADAGRFLAELADIVAAPEILSADD